MKLSLCALSAVFFSSSAESEAKTGVRGHRFLQDGGGGGGGGGMGGGGGGGRGGTTCSATVAPSFGSNPSNGTCITTFQRGSAYAYPEVSHSFSLRRFSVILLRNK